MRTSLLAAMMLFVTSPSRAGDEPGRELADYRRPEGWGVRVAAAEPLVVNPVTMTFGDDGRLYVIEWKAGRGPNDHIKVLTDDDGDGTFDRAEMFMDNLELPAGILFWDGWVYVTLDHDVVRLKDVDGDGKFEVRQVIATGFGNDDSHHRVSGIAMGPEGWLYLTTGDSDAHARGSDGSEATVLRCGGVFRCRPDGSRMENVAFGMRNPWGNVAFDDAFHIFHTDNDNEGSPGFTGCRLLHVVDQGDYGWRLREGARCCAPDFERATWNGGRPGRLGWMTETGRGAPAGLCVLNSSAFPDRFRNLLVYPDVFRKKVRAYRLEAAGATYKVAEEIELLGSDEGLFRPTDAEVGPDGALYVLDWRTDSGGAGQLSGNGTTGRIYRLTWAGTKQEPARPTLARDRFSKLTSVGADRLCELLSDEDHGMRRAASIELMRRGAEVLPLADLLKVVDRDQSSPLAKLHSLGILWSLHADRPEVKTALTRGAYDPDARVRRFAFELMSRTAVGGTREERLRAGLALLAVRAGSTEEDPQVRRAAAMALGTLGRDGKLDDESLAPEWNKLLTAVKRYRTKVEKNAGAGEVDAGTLRRLSGEFAAAELLQMAAREQNSDAFLRDGVTRGLERLGPFGVEAVVKAAGAGDGSLKKAALFSLEGWRDDDAVASILAAATSSDQGVSEDERVALFQALREMVGVVPPEPLVNWLRDHRDSGVRPRVEALRLLAAMHQRAILAVGTVLPELLADPASEVRRATLVLARDVRSEKAKEALLKIVRSGDTSGPERASAFSALRGYEGLDWVPLVRELLPQATDPEFQLELLRGLASRDFPAAATLAEGLLNSGNRELRHEAIGLLGSKPGSAIVVARRFLAGELPAEDLSRVIDAVRPHASPELQASLQALVKKTMLGGPVGDEPRRLREFVGRFGNADRGKAIYLDTKKGACATCHRLEGFGGNVGPDLTRVWETLSFEKRVESILEPSKEIKEGFGTFKVATVDGRVFSGLLLSDTPDGVTLRNAEGREVRVAAKEIDEKGNEKASLMPAGVVGHLSLNEFADLLAFLGDRKAQESLKTASDKPGPEK